MKDIFVIANFCRDFSENDNGRFMYICKELSKSNRVEILTSDFKHSSKVHKEKLNQNLPFQVVFLHEPGYKKNISIKRFLSHFCWGKQVEKYIKNRKRPDVIYCAVPSLTAAYLAGRYCKREGIKFIIDIQDLWPEAFKMVFKTPIISTILFSPFKFLANNIYKYADEIIAVSQTYVDRAKQVNKRCAEGHVVFLGTKLEHFDNGACGDPVIKKPKDEIWIGYCGSLSTSYDIPNVIRAMGIISKQNLDAKLVVMGDGAYRTQFESQAKSENIKAVFLGRLEYNKMCATLKECDIVVNPIKKGSAASIINKHADYASSGLPVVNTQESAEYRNLVETYNMGLNCENENSEDLAEKLMVLISNPQLRIIMGQNARRCAEEKFDRENSYKEIFDSI